MFSGAFPHPAFRYPFQPSAERHPRVIYRFFVNPAILPVSIIIRLLEIAFCQSKNTSAKVSKSRKANALFFTHLAGVFAGFFYALIILLLAIL
ncbi:hypothetical protein RMO93_22005 [Escherichia coli]|uniref:hypothetical protein n=1 Tax=Escherichia coli TaxID=562 RepID=UPI002892C337|nr:hypothetical protein [Escherichia coli]WNK03484.1 hypothetical protein RMO93_22005 [Escherichia coli]